MGQQFYFCGVAVSQFHLRGVAVPRQGCNSFTAVGRSLTIECGSGFTLVGSQFHLGGVTVSQFRLRGVAVSLFGGVAVLPLWGRSFGVSP